MLKYGIHAIEYDRCKLTEPEILAAIDYCLGCKNIPLPCFRLKNAPENAYCKQCLDKLQISSDSYINPNNMELLILRKIKINCKYYEEGCLEQFTYNTIQDWIIHEKNCRKLTLTNSFKDDVIVIGSEITRNCIRCKSMIINKSHDCVSNLKNLYDTFLMKIDIISKENFELKQQIQFDKKRNEDRIDTLERRILYLEKRANFNQVDNRNNDLNNGQDQILNNQEIINSTFISDPSNLEFSKNIAEDCRGVYCIENVFCVFQNLNGDYLCAYPKNNNYISLKNLISNEIDKTPIFHNDVIFTCRYFLYKEHSRDYLISGSFDNTIKIFSFQNKSVKTIENCHQKPYIYSSVMLFLPRIEDSFVISSAVNDVMKVWSLKDCLFVKKIGDADTTHYVDVWENNNQNYIINSGKEGIKIYNFESGELYRNFLSNGGTHLSSSIHLINNEPHLIETDTIGNIRFWNINDNILSKTIVINGVSLRGFILWNNQYIIVSCKDKSFRIIDFEKNIVVNTIIAHDNSLCSVQKIILPQYGETLFTSSLDGKIKMWFLKKGN